MRLAAANVRSKLAEGLFLRTRLDLTRPVMVYATVTTRCNARCLMCDYWRWGQTPELPAAAWVRAMKSLRRFSGGFHVQFGSAEPLLKADLFDILGACGRMGATAGITTNGLLLNERNVDRILESRLFNVNVSIDSLEESVHDRIRGVPGILARAREGIDLLMRRKAACRSPLRVVLKPIVCAQNVRSLDALVLFARDRGLTGVNFQPINVWTEEARPMFDLSIADLEAGIERLVRMRKEGYPIMNSESAMRVWVDHFRSRQAGLEGPCTAVLRNLNILANGDVVVCTFRQSRVGNIAEAGVDRLWRSGPARTLRAELARCRRVCTLTCVEKRRWRDYLTWFSRFMD